MIFSNNITKIILKEILLKEGKEIDIQTYEYYLTDLLSYLKPGTIIPDKKLTINQSVDIVDNFLQEPYKSIFNEILFTTIIFDKTNRGNFIYYSDTDTRIINVPITKTIEDSYVLIHELMHYINSFPNVFYNARTILGEGISMSSEILLSYFMKDDNKIQKNVNSTIRKIHKNLNFIKILKLYQKAQEINLNEIINETSLDYINEIVFYRNSFFNEHMKYINGYIITKIIDDYEKLEYINKQVTKNVDVNTILNKFDYELNNKVLKKKLI